MKKAILSIAMLAAFSGAAVAAPINVGVVAVPGSAFLQGVTSSALSQVYSFQLTASAGSLVATLNSVDPDNSLRGSLYASNANGDLLGAALASTGQAVTGNTVLSYGAITAGYYALSYTASPSSSTLYSGQLITRVPAPAVLGLAGIGLLGLGFFSRRRAV